MTTASPENPDQRNPETAPAEEEYTWTPPEPSEIEEETTTERRTERFDGDDEE